MTKRFIQLLFIVLGFGLTIFWPQAGVQAGTTNINQASVAGGPYYLDKANETYVLTENITSTGTALVFSAQNVTLDLNGKTITFNTSGASQRYGVAIPPSYAHTNNKWAGSDITRWNWGIGAVIKNGSIVQAPGISNNCQSSYPNSPFCAALISHDESNITAQNLTITVSVGDTFAMYFEGGGNFVVNNNTINDNTTAVIHRHQGRAAIDFFTPSGSQGLEIFNNVINGARQWGIRVARSSTATVWAHIYNNQIYHNTIVTNGYGIGAHGSKLDIYDNIIHSANGRGIGVQRNNSDPVTDVKVHNNDIDVIELPSPEYPKVSAHGIKLEGCSNTEVYNNTVLSKGSVLDAGHVSVGAALDFSVDPGSNNYVHNNTFTARHLGGPGFVSGDLINYFATAIQALQADNAIGDTGLRIEDNTFITNDRFFSSTEWHSPESSQPPFQLVDASTISLARNTWVREATTLPLLGKDITFYQSSVGGLRFVDNVGAINLRNAVEGWGWDLNTWSAAYTGTVSARNADNTPATNITIQATNAQGQTISATTNSSGQATLILDEFSASSMVSVTVSERNPYQITALFPSGSKTQSLTVNSPNWQVTLTAAGGVPVDTIAPAAITNLAVSGITSGTATLTWTAPGDDGSNGTATTYDLRYSTSPIVSFLSATPVTGAPLPAIAGTNQSMTISGLSAATPYYFAIKTKDEVPNTSTLSNVPSATTLISTGVDTTAPAQITNLAITGTTQNSVTLQWTATGDDNQAGTATSYDMRYGTTEFAVLLFNLATQATGEPTPTAAGTTQSMTITGLTPGTTYYFALQAGDEVPNLSLVSNVPSGATTAFVPDTTPPATITNLAVPTISATTAILTWVSPGDDGVTGRASNYDLRYSTSPITSGNFNSATSVTGEPSPADAGVAQTMTVSGLSASTLYYFAMKTSDEVPNVSAISNIVSGTTSASVPPPSGGGGGGGGGGATGDTTAPAGVTDLRISDPTSNSVTLSWTASGDDGATGTAYVNDVRYSNQAITLSNFNSATSASGEPTPTIAGSTQTMIISGLTPNVPYYFALRVADEVLNWSVLSNVPTVTLGNSNVPDLTAPAAISSISIVSSGPGRVKLSWTVPTSSKAIASYDLRYSPQPIIESNFESATKASGEPTPTASGSKQDFIVTGLKALRKYYFALKTVSSDGKSSALGRIVCTPRQLPLSLRTNQTIPDYCQVYTTYPRGKK